MRRRVKDDDVLDARSNRVAVAQGGLEGRGANGIERGSVEHRGGIRRNARSDERRLEPSALVDDERQHDLYFDRGHVRRKSREHRRFWLRRDDIGARRPRCERHAEREQYPLSARQNSRPHITTNSPTRPVTPPSASVSSPSEVNRYAPSAAGVAKLRVVLSPGASAEMFALSGKHDCAGQPAGKPVGMQAICKPCGLVPTFVNVSVTLLRFCTATFGSIEPLWTPPTA